ncbi:MAG: DoxX family protein [Pyrinomonadaceae bacterium]|nr:DoxX family protein [Sphingobacteriaceae bacterium]
MIVFYLLAGINHFVFPEFYYKSIPRWIGWQREVTLVSGLFEILLALLLISPKTRRFGVVGIILMLILIFPANIQMALNYYDEKHPYLWLMLLRLPLQFLLIWWAYSFIKPQPSRKPQP